VYSARALLVGHLLAGLLGGLAAGVYDALAATTDPANPETAGLLLGAIGANVLLGVVLGFGLGLFRHGLVLGELGRHREAHAALERALVLEPSNPEYARAVAFALMKSGRPDEAEALFGQLASLPGFEAARRERDQLRSRRLVKMAPDGGP
jgi:tetratricopeptide (TPR) repeat protein